MKHYQFIGDKSDTLPIGKIICLARNYKKHAEEMNVIPSNTPVFFLKPSSSIIYSGDTIRIPKQSKSLHHEVEMGVVIGKDGKNIDINKAYDYIWGYNVCLDITARDIQSHSKRHGLPWTIAKGFDTFAPISPVIQKAAIKNPHNIDISLKVNNAIKQRSNTNKMIWTIPEIISYISDVMTLECGDLIMTGTPEGIGQIKKEDILYASLGSYCSLKVDVI
jgi:2-keto-4-pentenoate hydratase/2-oxohepta-3-ene-1,7-dioic acid hydratase in catechol pathway